MSRGETAGFFLLQDQLGDLLQESDYVYLYLVADYQKIRLSPMAGDLSNT
jgi:hypothetical protein